MWRSSLPHGRCRAPKRSPAAPSTTTHRLFLSFHLVPVYLISENFVSAISPQLNTLRPSGPCLPLFSFIPPFSQVNQSFHSDAPRSSLHATIPFVSRSLHQPSKPHSFILDLPSLPCFTFACLASVLIVSLLFDISGTCTILI
jgi:hypothetical protein